MVKTMPLNKRIPPSIRASYLICLLLGPLTLKAAKWEGDPLKVDCLVSFCSSGAEPRAVGGQLFGRVAIAPGASLP